MLLKYIAEKETSDHFHIFLHENNALKMLEVCENKALLNFRSAILMWCRIIGQAYYSYMVSYTRSIANNNWNVLKSFYSKKAYFF